MLKKRIADRLDARYARRSTLQKIDKRVNELALRLSALEQALPGDAATRTARPASADMRGELTLLRHQVTELTRLLAKD